MMTSKELESEEIAFRAPLDPAHSGLKLAEMGSFLGGGLGVFLGASLLLPNAIGIAAILGIAAGVGGSFSAGQFLKERWPSGREIVADKERIALTKHGKIEAIVNAQEQVNFLAWYFEVKKDHPRARKGWYLLGLALEQDENFVIVYAAAPASDFEKMPLVENFVKLERVSNKENVAKSTTTMRRAGEQRRLYEAEVLRQMDGGDMNFADFAAFLSFLEANYPRWMPS